MSAPARTAPARPATGTFIRGIQVDRPWAACAVAAAVLLVIAALLPLWTMTLRAPQYPDGLVLTAYGTRLEGDLAEVNALNHYVGIGSLDPDTIRELALFPFMIAGLVLALVAGALARRKLVRVLLAAALWAVPLGMLVDLQWWLRNYGQHLHADAPFRLEPFTPKVLGTTTVVNFHSETMVAIGFWVMIAAALLVTAGPWVLRFVLDSWSNTGKTAGAAVAVLLLAGAANAAMPGPAGAAPEQQSIAAAIAAASPGATVVIPAGTYVEQLVLDKPITLIGEGHPVIDGDGRGDVVQITAEDVTVRGFIVRNSARQVSGEPTGIRVTADRATIEGNRLEDVLYGIALQDSGGHVVRGNAISSVVALAPERRGHALYVWNSEGNLVTDNVIELAKDGIFLGFVTQTRIERNSVSRVRYGLHTMYARDVALRGNVFRNNVAGASLMYSHGLSVVDNEFSGNRSAASGYGLLFKDMDDVELVGNRIHHNRLGLTMEGAPATPGSFVTLRGNLIAYNQIAMELFTTTSVTFVENSFVGNLQQVETRGGSLEHRNRWSLNGRGNYWDDYRGYDANGDGVGDIAYRYEGAFDDLVRQNEAVRAYSFSPARSALDLAVRWFPVHRPVPRVVDAHPLMAPTVGVRNAGSTIGWAAGAISAALVLVPLAVFTIGARTFGKRWA